MISAAIEVALMARMKKSAMGRMNPRIDEEDKIMERLLHPFP